MISEPCFSFDSCDSHLQTVLLCSWIQKVSILVQCVPVIMHTTHYTEFTHFTVCMCILYAHIFMWVDVDGDEPGWLSLEDRGRG